MDVCRPRNSVCAVIVLFNPELALLQRLLARIGAQVEWTLVVNNGSPREVLVWLDEQKRSGTIGILNLGDNLGIAAAHNRGIDWARTQGADYVLLLDQDSLPASNMVERLLATLCTLQAEGALVAAVGPRYRDPRRPELPSFIRWGFLSARGVCCSAGNGARPVAVDFLISSGALIPRAVLARVGGMEEALFIDAVDFEWCFRVTARGYRLYGVGDAEMGHSLGDRVIRISRSRAISVRSPLRLYYFMRNCLLLYRRPYVSWAWVCQSLRGLIHMFALFSFFVPPKSQNARMMALGFLHGIQGRSGRYDPESGRLTDLPTRSESFVQPRTPVPGHDRAA